jgi:voltage-gated potassium channel
LIEKPTQLGNRRKIHEVIFEADTPAGKTFDVLLLILILLSVFAVVLESVEEYDRDFHRIFTITEWVLTILFSIEFLLRIYCVTKPWSYVKSFYGIVDILAILPTYLSLFFVGSHYMLTIRILRLLRVFRIFKVARFLNESRALVTALKSSRPKIMIFLFTVVMIVIIVGSAMYLIEGSVNPTFTSIPKSIYWAIVTMTTVGYGDITPQTNLGQFLSAILMIAGYGIIAVPTGIVSAEMSRVKTVDQITTQSCPACSKEGHDKDAEFCKYCGELL